MLLPLLLQNLQAAAKARLVAVELDKKRKTAPVNEDEELLLLLM